MCNNNLWNEAKLNKDFSENDVISQKFVLKKYSLWLTFLVDAFSASGIKTGFGRIPGTPTMTIYASISYRTSIPTYAAICQSLIFYGKKESKYYFQFCAMRTLLPSLQVMDCGRYGRYETFCLVSCQHTVTHQSQKHEQSVHVCVCLWRGGMACKIWYCKKNNLWNSSHYIELQLQADCLYCLGKQQGIEWCTVSEILQ